MSMETISFKLDMFEGPLDLLLHLIAKHKLNIYDVEISLLLEQYMEYMNAMDAEDYEQAADFLEMAAQLIYIKTCSLLPKPDEAEELKKDLQGRIIEYAVCKQLAEGLRAMYAGGDIFVRKPVKLPVNKTYTRVHEASVLYDAYMGISSKIKEYKPLRAAFFSPIVSHRIVSVTSKIIYVLKKLYKTGKCEMSGLYDGITDKSERIATFLAVLELTKSGRIYINDDNTEICFRRTNKKHSDIQTPLTAVDEREDTAPEVLENAENAEITENLPQESLGIEPEAAETPGEDELAPQDENPHSGRTYIEYIAERVAAIKASSRVNPKPAAVPAAAEITDLPKETVKAEEPKVSEQIEEAEAVCEDEPKCIPTKPNLWSGKYYWGLSPAGAVGNYCCWKYGRFTRIECG